MECRGNVLVVDDEFGPRESIRMVMKPYHHTVMAESGSKALQCMSHQNFDLVTLDLNMPDINGIDILKKIREKDEDVQIVIVTGYGTLSSAQQAIRYGAFDYITKPFNISDIVSVANSAICKKRLQEKMRCIVTDLQQDNGLECLTDFERSNMAGGFSGSIKQAFSLYRDLGLMDFIEVLSRTLEEKNQDMHQHSKRVNDYAQIVARSMGLSEKEQENLHIAAFLHDIGKVGISNDILNKNSVLTVDEWQEIKKHPGLGVDIVQPLALSDDILSIILHHHESYDGKGYPYGLKGEEIPLAARIIRIVDSYDAMVSNRPYRKARSIGWVVDEIESCAGIQFDPDITGLFVDILKRPEKILSV